MNLRPLGYEQADPRLMHPTVAITPQATLARRHTERRSVSSVPAGPATSWSRFWSRPPAGRQPVRRGLVAGTCRLGRPRSTPRALRRSCAFAVAAVVRKWQETAYATTHGSQRPRTPKRRSSAGRGRQPRGASRPKIDQQVTLGAVGDRPRRPNGHQAARRLPSTRWRTQPAGGRGRGAADRGGSRPGCC